VADISVLTMNIHFGGIETGHETICYIVTQCVFIEDMD
jgi:hypothetical protein